jgi:signal transduction histidine kinase/CheY-like chemotaxis protein
MAQYIVGISIILQICAAIRALQLIPLTGHRMSWGLIAAATLLMSVRRSISLYRGLSGEVDIHLDPIAEAVALSISVFMVVGIFRIHSVFLDLQTSRENSALESKVKSEFIANMSHEIRTPMTAIIGFAEILAEGTPDTKDSENSADLIHSIQGNAKYLLTIINDILDVSKIEAGKMDIECIRIDPVDIANEVASTLKPRAHEKNIDLSIHYDSPIPSEIHSDPTRIRQILTNIIGNAVKFTNEGMVAVHISSDVENQRIRFSVRDTGIGMSPEYKKAVCKFEAFTQADCFTTRKFGGTGLGLKISNSLAQLLDGSIQIESELGEGSTFTLELPTGNLSDVQMLTPEQVSASTASPTESQLEPVNPACNHKELAGCRILIAEDGPDNQRLLRYHLEKAGASVWIVENGHQAIEAVGESLLEKLFDLVLMDMQMPQLDGYDATRQIRNRGHTLPIIAITAHAMEDDRQKCINAGCDEYLSKPINKTSLINTCSIWFNPDIRRCA